MVGDFGEPAPPQKDLGASPLNSLNLVVFFPRLSSDLLNCFKSKRSRRNQCSNHSERTVCLRMVDRIWLLSSFTNWRNIGALAPRAQRSVV